MILGSIDRTRNVLVLLGIKVERARECNLCKKQDFFYYFACEECLHSCDSDGNLMCESCGVYSDDVIFQGDKCQACVVEFAEDPFGMF